MNIKYELSFIKDLKKIKDMKALLSVKDVIVQCQEAANISKIKNLLKLTGYDNFYRIRIGEYRLGLEVKSTFSTHK